MSAKERNRFMFRGHMTVRMERQLGDFIIIEGLKLYSSCLSLEKHYKP